MKYLKSFLRVFGSSLFPTDKYYRTIPEHKLSFSLKYFFTLIVIISLFTSVVSYGVLYPEKNINNIKSGVDEFLNSYPKDLKIEIKNGMLSTNLGGIYKFWWTGISNPVLVINESADLQKMVDYKALIVISKDKMIGKKFNTNQYEISPINPAINSQFDYSYIQSAKKTVNEIFTLMPFLWVILLILIYAIVPIILTAVKITYLFLISLVVFVIFKIISRKLEFIKVFQLSLHSSTLPTIVGALFALSIENVGLQGLFFVLTMTFLCAAVYEVYVYKEPK